MLEEKTTGTEDSKFIKAILENDAVVLTEMYREFLPVIVSLLSQNNGNEEEAKDVLQDGLVVIFEKANLPGFQLTSSFKTYLYSICRFIWLRKLRKKQRTAVTIEDDMGLKDDADVEKTLEEQERWGLFNRHFKGLAEECRTVLRLFFEGVKMKEIAKKAGYTEQFAKSKKYLCKKALLKKIQGDRKYKELLG